MALSPLSGWDDYRKNIPSLTERVLNDSGHFPFIDDPRFPEALGDFL